MRYAKVIFGVSSGHSNYIYKIDEVNVANNWNTNATSPALMGGFSFLTEENIFNWLYKGNTLYEVTIPLDAEIVNCYSEADFTYVYRTNKIIINNPRTITDAVALKLYKIANKENKFNLNNIVSLIERNFINTIELWLDEQLTFEIAQQLLNKIQDLTIDNECIKNTRKKLLELIS